MSVKVKLNSRRGYTLFELLLTLGLTAALLALISTAIGLFERLSSAGRVRAEQSQISRALLDRMESDLRCVIFREQPPDVEDKANTIVPFGALSVEDEFKIKDPAGEYGNATLGIIGDEQHLFLHVDRIARVEFHTGEANFVPTGIHYVIWTVSTTAAGDDSGRTSGNSTLSRKPSRFQSGLARFTIDKLPLQSDPSEIVWPAAVLAGEKQGRVLAGEVGSIRFRYQDHDGWHYAWNSVVANRLPRSIEVTMTIESRAEIPNADNRLRVVIPITLSEPFVPQHAASTAPGGQP